MIFTEQQIQAYFNTIKNHLLNPKNRKQLLYIRSEIKKTDGPGVYLAFDKNNLVYVGESGNLYGRMQDIGKTLNHTFRRSLGELKFNKHKNYFKASSSKKHHVDIELLLDQYIRAHITFSYLPVSIGRKEFEEWMQEKNKHLKWLNKRTRRK